MFEIKSIMTHDIYFKNSNPKPDIFLVDEIDKITINENRTTSIAIYDDCEEEVYIARVKPSGITFPIYLSKDDSSERVNKVLKLLNQIPGGHRPKTTIIGKEGKKQIITIRRVNQNGK